MAMLSCEISPRGSDKRSDRDAVPSSHLFSGTVKMEKTYVPYLKLYYLG